MAETEKVDKAAAERAARLREQVERIKRGDDKPPAGPADRKPNPRDFIHKRMRELDRKS